MKKLLGLTAGILALIPAATAHAGLNHTYNGVSVTTLVIMLWAAVAAYEEIGDTVLGHWILFGAVFTALYLPVIHPHVRIDDIPLYAPVALGFAPVTVPGGFLSVAIGVLAVGGVTGVLHRLDYLPVTRKQS